MTAGTGIVHSERSPASPSSGASITAFSSGLACPRPRGGAPTFTHHPAPTAALVEQPACARGSSSAAYRRTAPVRCCRRCSTSPSSSMPAPSYSSRLTRAGVYLMTVTSPRANGHRRRMLVFERAAPPGSWPRSRPSSSCSAAHRSAPRHIWWNFVSSSQARIERPTTWQHPSAPNIPGDDVEFIPAPVGTRTSPKPGVIQSIYDPKSTAARKPEYGR